ncbi:MAG: class I SAM-dependent methyltransferase, partial [Actinobacteria bacterium]|nr:class I SAM-dependent methyltransferase [Actinomycetota bacterium]
MKELIKKFSKEVTVSQVMNRKILKKIIKSFKGRTLDVGCGELMTSLGLKKTRDYVGIDFVPTKDATVVGDIHKLPFENDYFDNCICNTVLEHVKNQELVLMEMYRVLKPSGKLLVS